jgi:hypothetical protein
LQVSWQKDGIDVDPNRDVNFIVSNEGNLIISQMRPSDVGNYTCIAQNVASRRASEPAQLTTYGQKSFMSLSLAPINDLSLVSVVVSVFS